MWPFRTARIYLDHAASTPICAQARHAQRRAENAFANPGSIHADGVAARRYLDDARAVIASELAVKPRQVVFTSGSTEANNLALLGIAERVGRERGSLSGTHWIVSAIEHPSVLQCFSEIERRGGSVTHLEPDERGIIAPPVLARALRPETALISIGWANHEVGTVQPLRALARAISEFAERTGSSKPLFHSDMGQAPLYLPPQVHTLGLDLAVLGSGKLYGPRGIAALYVADSAQLVPLMHGGGQERGLRPGTEDVALTAGFAAALAEAGRIRTAERHRVQALRDTLAAEIGSRLDGAVINTPLAHALPHLLNISLPGTSGEYAVLALDRAGIAVSTRSACSAGEKRSPVVMALAEAAGSPVEIADARASSTIRFSFGRGSAQSDIRRVIDALIPIVRARPHAIVRAWTSRS